MGYDSVTVSYYSCQPPFYLADKSQLIRVIMGSGRMEEVLDGE